MFEHFVPLPLLLYTITRWVCHKGSIGKLETEYCITCHFLET